MRHLVLCFDGTWNQPDTDLSDGDSNTNVRLLHGALRHQTTQGIDQLSFYCAGVGTSRFSRLRGGIFGWGLSDRLLAGYRYLVKHYRPEDRVFLVGFSRGAYTARSLAGMIERVGLLHPRQIGLVDLAFQQYQQAAHYKTTLLASGQSRAIRIESVAVWDTVGALGIPIDGLNLINRRFEFHNTHLGRQVRSAFQALAIDEHRDNYRPALWKPPSGSDQVLEQRWFAGAHSDIGGGYRDRRLADLSLDWMMGKLESRGLAFNRIASIHAKAPPPVPCDSYQAFLKGFYALAKPRYLRPIGQSSGTRETIDDSVFELMMQSDYAPENRLGAGYQAGRHTGQRLKELVALEATG